MVLALPKVPPNKVISLRVRIASVGETEQRKRRKIPQIDCDGFYLA